MKTHHIKDFVRRLLILVILFILTNPSAIAQTAPIHWVGDSPEQPTGVSWGVPWPRGEVSSSDQFELRNESGDTLPLQSWPMAYWPDGSIKWSGLTTVAGPADGNEFELAIGTGNEQEESIEIRDAETTLEIDTGPMQMRITRWGGDLFRSMTVDGRDVARDAKLIAISQQGLDDDPSGSAEREEFQSRVSQVTLESAGPVRAVVKIEGVHKSLETSREWLPFVIRFYFHAGQSSVRMVHSFIYDGEIEQDMIKGLGLEIAIPLREQMHNRHIRFSGEGDGLWAEPVLPMVGRGGRFVRDPDTGVDLFPRQLEGEHLPDRQAFDVQSQNFLDDWAVWSDFKLMQPNADGFTIQKRTGSESAWIPAGAGKRASGLVFAGDASGGLAVSMKDFWQSYPSGLEVQNMDGGQAHLRLWLWSPESDVMDMRHYDTQPHGLQAAYEDVQQGFSDAYGVARTSEITLFATEGVPDRPSLATMAAIGSAPPLLSATPEYLHSTGVFGYWSLPDRSTPFKQAVEERLESILDFYKTAIDEHRWYGFWDFGDVMHSYDNDRHVWRYDLGGMAWANTELMPDMWLWYSFMRTGRADVFRMAEAMTRHTQEVDVYHNGQFAGLGSRHNVRHWGDGAKEVRISQSAIKRYYYYLTTDERTGDLMHETTINSLEAITALDPMRLAQPPTDDEPTVETRLRMGPDWLALIGNWMTEWERTGDNKWRDMIMNGAESAAEFPYGLRTGQNLVVGLDPETGELTQLSDQIGEYNLATIMGGGEVGIELSRITDNEAWDRLWLQYTRLYYAPADTVELDMETGSEGEDAAWTRPDRLAAYAYMETGNPAFAEQALRRIYNVAGTGNGGPLELELIEPPHVLNPVWEARRMNTNDAAQWSLSAIEILEMISDQLPEEMP